MLDKKTAKLYYDSLHFNHYKSGGTCEQRVLVLRARFDRILEEITVKNFNPQSAYVEKLQNVFSALPKKFKEKQKKECHALRKYLNGVQHSTYEADEDQYRISVQRLCKLIFLCSGEDIPKDLKDIWSKQKERQRLLVSQKNIESTNIPTNVVALPMVICIDCIYIENSEQRRDSFNRALSMFITDIYENEMSVDLRVILIGKKTIKFIVSKTGEVSTYKYEKVNKGIIIQALNKSVEFISNRLNKNEMSHKPSSIFVPMLSSDLLGMIDTKMKTLELEKEKYLQIIPVGLTKGMELNHFRVITEKNKAMILRDDKYNDFFEWLYMSVKTICK